MNQWIWLIFITCDKHCVNMKTRLNVIVYFLFLNGAKRGVDINVGNISVGNYFVQEVFRRFFRKWKSPLSGGQTNATFDPTCCVRLATQSQHLSQHVIWR